MIDAYLNVDIALEVLTEAEIKEAIRERLLGVLDGPIPYTDEGCSMLSYALSEILQEQQDELAASILADYDNLTVTIKDLED